MKIGDSIQPHGKTLPVLVPFDPTTLDHAMLVETNNRLNRRCQKLESQICKYRRRYASVYKPAQYLLKIAEGHVKFAQNHHDHVYEDWKKIYERRLDGYFLSGIFLIAIFIILHWVRQ